MSSKRSPSFILPSGQEVARWPRDYSSSLTSLAFALAAAPASAAFSCAASLPKFSWCATQFQPSLAVSPSLAKSVSLGDDVPYLK